MGNMKKTNYVTWTELILVVILSAFLRSIVEDGFKEALIDYGSLLAIWITFKVLRFFWVLQARKTKIYGG